MAGSEVDILIGDPRLAVNLVAGSIIKFNCCLIRSPRSRGEVVELQANVAALEKKGGRIKTSQCGPKRIFCVEVEPQRFDGQGSDSGKIFMIPKKD